MSFPHSAPSVAVKPRRGSLKPAPVQARARGRQRARPLVADEELFKDILVRERKRADRFDQAFALLLLEPAQPLKSAALPAWSAAMEGLAAVKRETDLPGWFERGAVLGLLLPDLPDAATASRVELRVKRELARRLDGETLAGLSIRLYAHAGRWGDGNGFHPIDPLLEAFPEGRGTRLRDGAKRALDIAGSLALLLVLLPLLLVIAGFVRGTSHGPVLFRQTRVGRRGEPFTMLKFRTMHVNADPGLHKDYVTWFIQSSSQQPVNGHEVFKLTNDPRVTPVGHVLRRTSLDELPQFWNVLCGDMSLVGPRPPLPYEVEKYQPWHRRRVLEVKPGITGLWQVNGRSRTTFDEMVRLDLRYARTYSLWTDVKILAATPRAVLSGKGAA